MTNETTVTGLVSFGRQLSIRAAEQPDGVAMTLIDRAGADHPIRWLELERRALGGAHALRAAGVGAGDLVGIELPTSIDHVVVAQAAWKLGATVLPLRWDLPAWERDRVLATAAPTLLVSAERRGPGTVAVGDLLGDEHPCTPLPDVVARPAYGIATSGSTGTPKVIFSRAPGEDVPGRSAQNPSAVYLRYRPGQTQLVPAPLYHMNGFVVVHLGLFEGQGIVLMERFDPEIALDAIERHRINTAIMVPTMLHRMLKVPGIEARDFSSIESIVQGGSALPRWLGRRWIDLLGPERFYVIYGSSENAGVTIARGDEWLHHEGTVGHPLLCEVKVLDPDGDEVPVGEVGEVHLRWIGQVEPSFSYVGGTAKTRPDLFSSIGDMGYVDDDGYLFIVDRRTDMIVTGGANVYASEVEAAILEHDAVTDVVVVGLADDDWGQRVHAIVQLDSSHPDPGEHGLRAHCRERLAAYKVPKSVEFVALIERSDIGKLRRADYRDRPARAT